ncbi:MAG TPA: hypothetical protein VM890_13380 [Longimicrobium sp.]|nr:hypothetical protein [Longimicrobium sp.]
MKKLTLELNDLRVESFAVQTMDEVRGTVAGQNEPAYTRSCDGSCVNTCNSCVNTCLNTCQNSCWNTCGTCNATCGAWCTHPG